MGPDLSIIVADASRIAAIRGGAQLPGRVMHFTAGNIGAALESIRAYRPKLVAVDAVFAQSPAGVSFMERVDAMGGIAMRLVLRRDGRWVTTEREAQPAERSSPIAVTAPLVPAVSTRRAPRFKVLTPLEATVEGSRATLINLSTHGAQLVSLPALRPNQRIKVALADTDEILNLTAQVAWSCFEQGAASPDPYYRVGLEFTDAAQRTIDAYRVRYCAEQPIPEIFR